MTQSQRRALKAKVRGPGLFAGGWPTYRSVQAGQPLLLIREPTNRFDPNAIIVATLHNQQFGYIERDAAAILAPLIDGGELWVGRILRPPIVGVRHCVGLFWVRPVCTGRATTSTVSNDDIGG